MPYRFLFLYSLSLVLFNGCGGPAKPEGFPDLVRPVTVKILKDGTPLSDVSIALHPKDSALTFTISGKTGANGIATLQTARNTYSRPGAPVGKYLVQLTEVVEVDMSSFAVPVQKRVVDGVEIEVPSGTVDVMMARTREYDRRADAARRFSKVLGSANQSPLELEITASCAAEFDVGKY